MKKSKKIYFLLTSIAIFLFSPVGHAQSWPSKPLNMIVAFPAGGTSDILGRVIAESLSPKLGQPVIVENKPGASTIIGVMAALRAPADGNTLLVSAGTSFVVLPAVKSNLPYDIERDIYPINLSVSSPLVLITSADKPYAKISDLIAQAKIKPKSIRYTSYGPGTTPHFVSEMFADAAQIDVEAIPYKGSNDAILAIMRGDADFGFEPISVAAPQIKAGKLKALAVTSLGRSRFLPDVPGMEELRLPTAYFETFYGVAISSSVPKPIASKLAKDISEVMNSPEVKEKMKAQSLEVVNKGPEAMATTIKTEIARFKTLNKRLKVDLE